MHSGVWLRLMTLTALTVLMAAQRPEVFTLMVHHGLILTALNSSVSLACELSPLFNAEPLEVRWYRSGDFDKPALLYKDHKIQEAPVDPRYKGRVSLTGGLERGNVSLTLERVTLADGGEYVCRVSNAQWYEKASVFLTVKVLGGTPVVSVAEARGGGGRVNVTCSSEGWSPYPTLTWRNKEGTEIRNGREVLNTPDPQGLVRISSWMLSSPSDTDWLSCTVSLSEEEKKESRILPRAPTEDPSYSSSLVLLVRRKTTVTESPTTKEPSSVVTGSSSDLQTPGHGRRSWMARALGTAGRVSPPPGQSWRQRKPRGSGMRRQHGEWLEAREAAPKMYWGGTLGVWLS
uniref:Ig-like domain-containing protein n=1 Tax=Oncorhynchus tshawytscha TaxID=74940 RepID=A0AAZ3QSY3_ONCTS